ncbi:MAG: MMPL family transporter [Acidobacteriota bacterium]|nr:MMPL family transporter [Acidobacteriota bacterium]
MISYAIRAPKRTLLFVFLCCFAAAVGLPRLTLRTDGHALIPQDDPAVLFDKQQREVFEIRDSVVVMIEIEQGIFHTETLRLIDDLSRAISALDEIEAPYLLSLSTETGSRFKAGEGFRTLLDPLPETPEEMRRLRDELERVGLYQGILFAESGQAAAILAGIGDDVDRSMLLDRLRQTLKPFRDAGPTISLIGAPVAESLLGNHILADLGVPSFLLNDFDGNGDRPFFRKIGLVAPALFVMALIFLFCFRRPVAALLPLMEVGCCLVVVFGLMGWFGVPVYLTTAVLPVILTAVGVADEIHIFRYYAASAGSHDAAERVRETMAHMTAPIVKTSLTTSVGFLSFMVSSLPPVRAFGLFTAIGVMVCLLFSVTAIPALLTLLGPERLLAGSTSTERQSFFARLSMPLPVRFGLVPLLVLLIVTGIAGVEVQDSWVDGFDPDSRFRKAAHRFDEQFYGMHQLYVTVSGEVRRLEGHFDAAGIDHPTITMPLTPELAAVPPKSLANNWIQIKRGDSGGRRTTWKGWISEARHEDGNLVLTYPRDRGSAVQLLRLMPGDPAHYRIDAEPMQDPVVLAAMEDLEDHIGDLPGVGGVLGPAGYLKATMRIQRPDDPDAGVLPERPVYVRYAWNNYRVVRGKERAAAAVSGDFGSGLVTLFLENPNYKDTEQLMSAIRSYADTRLPEQGLKLGFAGDVAVSQALIQALVRTQTLSLLLSLTGIFIIVSLLGRSWRWGILGTLPSAFAVAFSFGMMGHFSIPLGVATSMFAGMTLGVGVDFAIHYLTWYDRHAAHGHTRAAREALAGVGPAIAIDALAVGLGFSVLLLSRVPGNARLGGLLVMSIFACFVATVFFLPILAGKLFPSRGGTSPVLSGTESPACKPNLEFGEPWRPP